MSHDPRVAELVAKKLKPRQRPLTGQKYQSASECPGFEFDPIYGFQGRCKNCKFSKAEHPNDPLAQLKFLKKKAAVKRLSLAARFSRSRSPRGSFAKPSPVNDPPAKLSDSETDDEEQDTQEEQSMAQSIVNSASTFASGFMSKVGGAWNAMMTREQAQDEDSNTSDEEDVEDEDVKVKRNSKRDSGKSIKSKASKSSLRKIKFDQEIMASSDEEEEELVEPVVQEKRVSKRLSVKSISSVRSSVSRHSSRSVAKQVVEEEPEEESKRTSSRSSSSRRSTTRLSLRASSKRSSTKSERDLDIVEEKDNLEEEDEEEEVKEPEEEKETKRVSLVGRLSKRLSKRSSGRKSVQKEDVDAKEERQSSRALAPVAEDSESEGGNSDSEDEDSNAEDLTWAKAREEYKNEESDHDTDEDEDFEYPDVDIDFKSWVGKECRAVYAGDDCFYPAVVVSFDGDDSFTVKFSRGTVQHDTPRHDIQLLEDLADTSAVSYGSKPSSCDIWEAAKNGDYLGVEYYIKQGVNVDEPEPNTVSAKTPLMLACENGEVAIAKRLMQAGAEDSDGQAYVVATAQVRELLKDFGFGKTRFNAKIKMSKGGDPVAVVRERKHLSASAAERSNGGLGGEKRSTSWPQSAKEGAPPSMMRNSTRSTGSGIKKLLCITGKR